MNEYEFDVVEAARALVTAWEDGGDIGREAVWRLRGSIHALDEHEKRVARLMDVLVEAAAHVLPAQGKGH